MRGQHGARLCLWLLCWTLWAAEAAPPRALPQPRPPTQLRSPAYLPMFTQQKWDIVSQTTAFHPHQASPAVPGGAALPPPWPWWALPSLTLCVPAAWLWWKGRRGSGPVKGRASLRLQAMSAASDGDEGRVDHEVVPLDRPAVVTLADEGADHPCVSCGACCATFRVSFPFFEVAERGIPGDLVEQLRFPYVAMCGSNARAPRCVALQGTIGQPGTLCALYSCRPSPCRDFLPSLEVDGVTQNPRCDEARERHGLPPLEVKDWRSFWSSTGTTPPTLPE